MVYAALDLGEEAQAGVDPLRLRRPIWMERQGGNPPLPDQSHHRPATMTVNHRRFYVYAYLRTDGTPYYIGKGAGARIDEVKGHRVPLPSKERRKILIGGLTDPEAIEYEIALIYCLGRKDLGTGCLRNLTDGGEGAANPSAETLRKRSLALKKVKHTEEWVQKRRAVRMANSKTADKYGIRREYWEAISERERDVIRARFNRGLRGEKALLGIGRTEMRSRNLSRELGIDYDAWRSLPEYKRTALVARYKRTGKTGQALLDAGPSPRQRMEAAAQRWGVPVSVWASLSLAQRKALRRAAS